MATINKTIVIGLDGADWRLLKPWFEAGKLPTLAKLVKEGTSGALRSTIRPESSIAWSSFATGVNPGKHGVFGFVGHEAGTYQFQLTNGRSIAKPSFWTYLGEQGLNVGLINIPFTYPPQPVNGFLVSGMLTPSSQAEFTYPPQLKEELLSHFGNYLMDAGESMRDKAALQADVAAYTTQQIATTLKLMAENPWDFLTVVFTGPDRLQHRFWADYDPTHPLTTELERQQYGDALLAHYEQLDTAVSQIKAQLPENSRIILMSDHGFNGVARRFYINRWLQSEGLLTIKQNAVKQSRGLTAVFSRLKSIGWLRKLKNLILPESWGPAQLGVSSLARAVEWSQTQAFYAPDGGVRINVNGRDPEGIVAEGDAYDALCTQLSQKLLALNDPQTGKPVFHAVYRRDELYSGALVNKAPDLIVEPHRENLLAIENVVVDGAIDGAPSDLFSDALPYTGNHAYDGVLVAWGDGILADTNIDNAQIIDLAPTICAMMNTPIPDYMDGIFLADMFDPANMPQPTYQTVTNNNSSSNDSNFNQEEEDAVAQRLRELGYL